MPEGPYDIFKRRQAESEKEITKMNESMRQMEREKREKSERLSEIRHKELIKSMENIKGGIHITSGGNTKISDSNLTGHDSVSNSHPAPAHSNNVKWWLLGILGAIIAGLTVTYISKTLF
jgi:hypothetical protein